MNLINPKKPSKEYIKSVLQSEYLIATTDAINQCLYGWLEAVRDPGRIERARKLSIKSFGNGDLFAIGYCTYVYGYILQPLNPVNTGNYEQMEMEIARQ